MRHVVNLPYTVTLVALMARHRIDLVQVNHGLGGHEVGLAAMLLRRPRIGFFRAYWNMGRVQRRVFEPGILKFVAVSEHIANRAIADGIPRHKLIVATPPVIIEGVSETDLRAARARHRLDAGAPLFGIFGRIVPWKGQIEFLRAAALVFAKISAAKALVVGDAADGEREYMRLLYDFVEENGLQERVIFTGYREDVATYYELVDVAVHASIEPEPSGRVILEAMSYGTPVVASHLGGPKEFIEEGVDGFIVDPTDSARMAERVVTLLENEERRKTMGARGREKVRAVYGPEPYARAIEGAYREVLRSSASGRARYA